MNKKNHETPTNYTKKNSLNIMKVKFPESLNMKGRLSFLRKPLLYENMSWNIMFFLNILKDTKREYD